MDLEPDRRARAALHHAVAARAERFLAGLPAATANGMRDAPPAGLLERLGAAPGEVPGDLDALLDVFTDAAGHAVETAGGHYFGYFPAGGLVSAVLADALAATVNRYTGVSGMAPSLVALEHGVIRWFAGMFGLPVGSGGLLTSGASVATLAAVHAARHDRFGGPDPRASVYVTEHTHHCVAKAAAVAGLPAANVRVVPADAHWRLDVPAAEALIAGDAARGLRPLLLVATAGSTSTGTVDPIADAADLAARTGLWLHVDGAYGAAFQLTARGRQRLRGIERADSITLDPHKSLFLPYGTGLLLVRAQSTLHAAHAVGAHYLRDLAHEEATPDYADLGPELTREYRGLRLWLPLHLHGVAAFRAALDEKLDLAAHAYRELSAMPGIEVPAEPDLTVVPFRAAGGDDATARLLAAINDSGRIFLSSTTVDGRLTLRLCVLSHRTHAEHVTTALHTIRTHL